MYKRQQLHGCLLALIHKEQHWSTYQAPPSQVVCKDSQKNYVQTPTTEGEVYSHPIEKNRLICSTHLQISEIAEPVHNPVSYTHLDVYKRQGTYNLKIEVETVKGKKTSREGLVLVNPLADDPQSKEVAFERIVSPGKTARLYGSNLQNVTAILLGGSTVTDPTYVESEDGDYLEYTVPTDVNEGDYRIVLQDSEGKEYGADMVKVTKSSLIISGANRATANTDLTI